MNFNNYANEYSLHNQLTNELINLYGFATKYIKTTKVNPDKIFNEIQNLRADDSSVFTINVYPENTSGFDNQNDILSKFGIMSFDTINLYVSSSTMLSIFPDGQVKNGISDLILLPSGKVFEITDIEHQVHGVNNMYVYDNQKNVYILKCKPYNYNHDEIVFDSTITPDIPNFDALFDIAEKAVIKQEQETQSTVQKNVDAVFGDMG